MKTLSIREIRSQLGNLDHLIEIEHEIIITWHGKPIARLLPTQGQKQNRLIENCAIPYRPSRWPVKFCNAMIGNNVNDVCLHRYQRLGQMVFTGGAFRGIF